MTADRRPGHESGQKCRDARRRGHRDGHGDSHKDGHRDGHRDGAVEDTGGSAGHGTAASGCTRHCVARWVLLAMIRVATLVLCYLIVLVTTVRVIPVTGVFLYESSGVEATTPLNAQLTFWLLPFCFVVLLMLIAEVTAFRALWALGSRCTARMRPTRHTGPPGHPGVLGAEQGAGPQEHSLPMINRPKANRPRNGLSRNDAREAR